MCAVLRRPPVLKVHQSANNGLASLRSLSCDKHQKCWHVMFVVWLGAWVYKSRRDVHSSSALRFEIRSELSRGTFSWVCFSRLPEMRMCLSKTFDEDEDACCCAAPPSSCIIDPGINSWPGVFVLSLILEISESYSLTPMVGLEWCGVRIHSRGDTLLSFSTSKLRNSI